ncbi:MAG: hypothetical protein HRF40_01125 [Nitrososphaera sp.]|jgi:hypothetical protein
MMNNNRKYQIASIAGVAILGALLVAVFAPTASPEGEQGMSYIPKRILGLQTGDELPSAEAAEACGESLETIKSEAPFPVLTPGTLPEGYSLKSADYVPPDRVTLHYFDANVCGDNAGRLRDGVIELVAGPLNTITDARNGQEYVDRLVESWQKANATAFNFDGKPAVGYPAGVGTSRAIDENGEVVHTYQYDYPASIWVVDDTTSTVYKLTGYIPLEDLTVIARSLK